MITELQFYLRLLSRRMPAMAALFLLASGTGIVIAMRLPTTYQTEAQLLVESAQIPDSMLSSTVQVEADEQLDILQQRLMTRANLLDVARKNNVFANIGSMEPDEVVRQMRNRTKIGRRSGRNRATVMSIEFSGSNPKVIADVVNQYVTIVLATTTDFRTERAESTLSFFQQEVDQLTEDLRRQSQQIADFKRTNSNALPETLSFRLNRQSLLLQQKTAVEQEIQRLKEERKNIQRTYDATGSVADIQGTTLTPQQQRLRGLREELQAALGVYSEDNPKMKLLRNRIAALEGQTPPEGTRNDAVETSQKASSSLDLNLAEIDAKVDNAETEITELMAELERLDQAISLTPTVQIELTAMERDLENTQRQHAAAVQRVAQARMSERVELSAKGERITVLEPASVPTQPSGPNRVKIAGMGIGLGIGLAAGLFVLLELLNQAVRRPSDMVSTLKITPLATIPRIETAAKKRRRRQLQLIILATAIIAVPTLLWLVDSYYIPVDHLFQRIISRIL